MRKLFSTTKFLLLILCCSCGQIIEKIEGPISEDYVADEQKKTFCQLNRWPLLLNTNEQSQKTFKTFLSKLKKKKVYLTSIEKSVLWAIAQFNVAPILSTPTARLQLVMGKPGNLKYYDFSGSKKNPDQLKPYPLPYLYGLKRILQIHGQKSLKQLARLYDLHYPNQFFVSKELELFLAKHQKQIKRQPTLKKYYVRGDELLQENERLQKIKIVPLLNLYERYQKRFNYQTSSKLLPYSGKSPTTINCNFDLQSYEKSVFLIKDKPVQSYLFGYQTKNFVFMASSSQSFDKTRPIGKTPLFMGESLSEKTSICSIKKNAQEQIWLFSENSRDPGQHIYHLIKYGLINVKNIQQLDKMLRFSRHLFLSNPLRLIYESQRGSEKQLNRLLQLNFPIYNSDKLGNIWAFYLNQNNKNLIIDSRNQGTLSCHLN
jgi:hypothetical protein